MGYKHKSWRYYNWTLLILLLFSEWQFISSFLTFPSWSSYVRTSTSSFLSEIPFCDVSARWNLREEKSGFGPKKYREVIRSECQKWSLHEIEERERERERERMADEEKLTDGSSGSNGTEQPKKGAPFQSKFCVTSIRKSADRPGCAACVYYEKRTYFSVDVAKMCSKM